MGIRRWLSGTLRPDKVETDSLSTESHTITNETLVEWTKTTTQNYSTGNSWEKVTFDSEKDDLASDGDLSTDEIIIPDSGHYQVDIILGISNMSDGDLIGTRIRDRTNVNTVERSENFKGIGSVANQTLSFSQTLSLDAGTHVLEFRNFNSDCVIDGEELETGILIKREERN